MQLSASLRRICSSRFIYWASSGRTAWLALGRRGCCIRRFTCKTDAEPVEESKSAGSRWRSRHRDCNSGTEDTKLHSCNSALTGSFAGLAELAACSAAGCGARQRTLLPKRIHCDKSIWWNHRTAHIQGLLQSDFAAERVAAFYVPCAAAYICIKSYGTGHGS